MRTTNFLHAGRTAAGVVMVLSAACVSSRGIDIDGGGPTGEIAAASASRIACTNDRAGITLPRGFCAVVFADSIGVARHMTVAPNGDLFVTLRTRQNSTGGVVALRDSNGDGRADVVERFGGGTETGIGLRGDHLYVDGRDVILRYPLAAGSLRPSGAPDTIVMGLPTGGHGARNFVLDGNDLYVNVGSRTNACQVADRQLESPGIPDCPELATRAGIWRFAADRLKQQQADGERFATGLRNSVAFARHPSTGALYVVMHGRDNFLQNWPKLYDAEESANKPSEEMQLVTRGGDYGWPFCYHDPALGRRVLAPEYGGDKTTAGRCESTTPPIGAFPAHWAPNSLLFYTGSAFPARYREGAFIAFHGSWNRDPEPQAGYQVVFQPMTNGRPSGAFEPFATGFPGAQASPRTAVHRPTGLAMGPDGAMFISDDAKGRIWKVMYVGDR